MEIEDDVFFADLSKQIALLIMDDDEEFPTKRPSSDPLQGFPYAHQVTMPRTFTYELGCRRESKGTGVFIPRSSCPRRQNISERSASSSNQGQLPQKTRRIKSRRSPHREHKSHILE